MPRIQNPPNLRRRPRPANGSSRSGTATGVIDPAGELVCITVYKRGAMEVVRRLAA